MSYIVYVFRDKHGKALYVGCTKNWDRRYYDHSRRAPWFAEHHRIELSEHKTHRAGLDAEFELVTKLRPKHNICKHQRCPKCGVHKPYVPGKAYCNECFREYQAARRLAEGMRPRALGPVTVCPKCGGPKEAGPSYCRPCKKAFNKKYWKTYSGS